MFQLHQYIVLRDSTNILTLFLSKFLKFLNLKSTNIDLQMKEALQDLQLKRILCVLHHMSNFDLCKIF